MKEKIKNWLLWSQQYTQIDMLYVARGGFWSSLSFGVNSVLSLVLLIAFANLISKETYGIYKYILSLAHSLSFLTLTGMNMAVKQAVAAGREEVLPYAVKKQLKWNLLFLLGASALGSYYIFKGNHLFGASIFILGATYPLYAAFSTYGIYLSGKKQFKRNAVYGILGGAFYFVSMLAALFLTKNIMVLIAVYGISNLLPATFFYWLVLRSEKFKEAALKHEKEVFRYGGHLTFVNVFSTISQNMDKILVFQFLGPVSLAVYSIASVIPERISGFMKNFMTIIFPKLSERTIEEIRPVFYKRVFQSMAVGGAAALVFIVSAPFIFKIFFPQYLDSLFYARLLSLSFVFLGPANYVGNVFYAKKMIKTIYYSSITANILRMVLFVVLGWYFGIMGMIAATLLTYAAGTVFNFFLWQKEITSPKT